MIITLEGKKGLHFNLSLLVPSNTCYLPLTTCVCDHECCVRLCILNESHGVLSDDVGGVTKLIPKVLRMRMRKRSNIIKQTGEADHIFHRQRRGHPHIMVHNGAFGVQNDTHSSKLC